MGSKAKIIGFSPLSSELPVEQTIRNGIEKAAKKLRTKNLISNETIVSVTKFVGQGYAQLTEDAIEAILIIVRLEVTFLDPVYTGKAMDGLLSFLQISRIGTHEDIIFSHTGGVPALFAYNSFLLNFLD